MTEEFDNETVEETEVEEAPKKESVSDTVLRAYEQLENEAKGEEADSPTDDTPEEENPVPEGEEAPQQAATEEKPERKQKRRVVDFEKGIDPPHDWDARGKEWFKTLDKPAQENYKRISNQLSEHNKRIHREAIETKRQAEADRQELQVERQRYSSLESTLLPYAKEWSKKGITTAQGIAELAAFNDMVEKDSEKAILALARSRGIDIEIKNPKSKQGVASAPQLDYQQVYSQVKQDLTREEQARQAEAQRSAVANDVDSALASLQNETNEGGQYIYPDLHDNDFHRRLHPAVVGLKHADPDLSWAELLKRAYRSVGGRVIPRKSTAKPNYNGTLDAARRAASSRPGSSNGTIDLWKAKPGESHATSAQKAWELLTKQR